MKKRLWCECMVNKKLFLLKKHVLIVFLLIYTLFQCFCTSQPISRSSQLALNSATMTNLFEEDKLDINNELNTNRGGRQGAESEEVEFAQNMRLFTTNKTHPNLERRWINELTHSKLNLWAISDIDGDNIEEYALASKNRASVFVISGNNASYFRNINLGTSKARSINFIDFDGDASTELVVGTENNVLYFDLLNGSNGGIGNLFPDGRNVYEVMGINVDGDAAEEVAVAFWNQTTGRAELNFYNIAQNSSFLYKATHGYDSVIDRIDRKEIWIGIGNFTGDQYQDIVMGHYLNNTVYFFDGQDGTLHQSVNLTAAAEVGSLAVGDLDNNTIDDVVIGGYGSIYLINGTNGKIFVNKTITSSFDNLTNFYFTDIKIKQFNGNNEPKILAAGGIRLTPQISFPTGVATLLNPSGEVLYQFDEPGIEIISIDSGDFDNDTVVELITAAIDGSVIVHDLEFNGTVFHKNYFIFPAFRVIAANINTDKTTGFTLIAGEDIILRGADLYEPEVDKVTVTPYLPTAVDNIQFEVNASDPSGVAEIIVKILSLDAFGNEEFSEVFLSESQKKGIWKGVLFGSPSPEATEILFVVELVDILGNIGIIPSSQDSIEYYKIPLQTNTVWSSHERYDVLTALRTNGVANLLAVYQDDSTTLKILDANNGTEISSQSINAVGNSIAMYGRDLDADNLDDVILVCEDSIFIITSTGTDTISNISVSLDESDFKGAIGSFAGVESPCIAISSQEQLLFYDLVDGTTVLDSIQDAVTEKINDFHILTWEEGVEDLAIAGDEGTIYLIDGNSGELYVDTNVNSSLTAIIAADFDRDGFPEIVALNETGTLFFVDTETLEMKNITIPDLENEGSNVEILTGNYDEDDIPDIAFSVRSTVLLVNGSGIDNIIEEENPLQYSRRNDEATAEILSIFNGNFDTDNETELAIATDDGYILLIDGTGQTMSRFKAAEWIPREIQPLALVDLEDLGFQSLAVIGRDSLNMVIDNTALYQMYLQVGFRGEEGEFNQTTTIKQGDAITIDIEFRNIRDERIKDVSGLIIAENFEVFTERVVMALTPEGGSYYTKVSTSDLLPGTWYLYLDAQHDYYQNIRSLYEIEEARLIGKLVITATPSVEIEFITEEDYSSIQFASFAEIGNNYSSKVLKTNWDVDDSLEITILPKDLGKKLLDGLNVSASLKKLTFDVERRIYTQELTFETPYGNETVTDYIFDGYSFLLNTTGFWGGDDYQLKIVLQGEYISTRQIIVKMTILPQQLDIDFSNPIVIAILTIGSFLVAFILVGLLRMVYTSLSTDFNATDSFLWRGSLVFGAIFVILAATSIMCVDLELYEYAFLLSILVIFFLIFFFLLFFFRTHFLNLANLGFSLKRILANLGFIIIIFASLTLLLWIGENIAWFDYEVAKDTNHIPYTDIYIPSLYWEVGISGFLSGFCYIVIMQYIDTRGDIKSIKELFHKAEEGHFPKDPDVVKSELITQAQESFIGLIRGFVLWYVLVILTLTGSLKIWDVLQNIAIAVAAPFVIAAAILFRDKIHRLNPFR